MSVKKLIKSIYIPIKLACFGLYKYFLVKHKLIEKHFFEFLRFRRCEFVRFHLTGGGMSGHLPTLSVSTFK